MEALFANPSMNTSLRICSVNSINISRILAQITYYLASYFSLIQSRIFHLATNAIRFVVPKGNLDFAKRMGPPIAKLVIATNEKRYSQPLLAN